MNRTADPAMQLWQEHLRRCGQCRYTPCCEDGMRLWRMAQEESQKHEEDRYPCDQCGKRVLQIIAHARFNADKLLFQTNMCKECADHEERRAQIVEMLRLAYDLEAEYDVSDSEFGQQQNDAPDSLNAIINRLEELHAPFWLAAQQLVQQAEPDEDDCPSQPGVKGDECGMCSGEYCATHYRDPCDCDVVDRHTSKTRSSD